MNSLLLFGGTFDPIHNGHLQAAINVQNLFKFDEFYFVPCRDNLLKYPPLASAKARAEMIQAAIERYKTNYNFNISYYEINHNEPSYTFNTIKYYRALKLYHSISILIGTDAYQSFSKWHKPKEILNNANLLVMNRADYKSDNIKTITEPKQAEEFKLSSFGLVRFFNAGDFPISSTMIRKKIADGHDTKQLLPDEVYDYIKKNKMYSI